MNSREGRNHWFVRGTILVIRGYFGLFSYMYSTPRDKFSKPATTIISSFNAAHRLKPRKFNAPSSSNANEFRTVDH